MVRSLVEAGAAALHLVSLDSLAMLELTFFKRETLSGAVWVGGPCLKLDSSHDVTYSDMAALTGLEPATKFLALT